MNNNTFHEKLIWYKGAQVAEEQFEGVWKFQNT